MKHTCRYCGTELAGYEKFCPGCGNDLQPGDESGFRPTLGKDDYVPQEQEATRQMPRSAASGPSEAILSEDSAARPARRASEDIFFEDSVRRPAKTASDDLFFEDSARRNARPASGRRPDPRTARPQNRRPAQKHASRPQKRRRRRAPGKGLLLIALAAAAVLLIVTGVRLLSGWGEDRALYPFTPVLDQYFDSVRTGNANKFVTTRPAEYTAYLTAGPGSTYGNESEYRAETALILQARLNEYEAEYGAIRSITYELTEVRNYVHRCEALSDVLTGWYDFTENAVSDACIVNGTYTIKGSKASGEFPIEELLLIQIGENWYFSPDAGSYWRAE